MAKNLIAVTSIFYKQAVSAMFWKITFISLIAIFPNSITMPVTWLPISFIVTIIIPFLVCYTIPRRGLIFSLVPDLTSRHVCFDTDACKLTIAPGSIVFPFTNCLDAFAIRQPICKFTIILVTIWQSNLFEIVEFVLLVLALVRLRYLDVIWVTFTEVGLSTCFINLEG